MLTVTCTSWGAKDNTGIWHALRDHATGLWGEGFLDVQAETDKQQGQHLDAVTRVACAVAADGELHVLAVTHQFFDLYHTSRNGDGTWPFAFGWVNLASRGARPELVGPTPAAACAASSAGGLHVVALNSAGVIYHTIATRTRASSAHPDLGIRGEMCWPLSQILAATCGQCCCGVSEDNHRVRHRREWQPSRHCAQPERHPSSHHAGLTNGGLTAWTALIDAIGWTDLSCTCGLGGTLYAFGIVSPINGLAAYYKRPGGAWVGDITDSCPLPSACLRERHSTDSCHR
jgi:hypothetical protein